MIVDESVHAVRAARTPDGWSRPLHGSWCFDAVPGTVERLLTGATTRATLPPAALGPLGERAWQRVVLVYLDAFAWRRLERHADHPFLRRVEADGRTSLVTAQFPSTTAVHVTTIHSGLPIAEHGVLEWFCYEPRLDRIIAPLLFAIPGTPERDALVALGLEARDVFGERSLYVDLATAGVRSTVYQSALFTPSAPSEALLVGATTIGFPSPMAGLAAAAAGLAADGPTYTMAYLESADGVMHRSGAWSDAAAAEVEQLLDGLEALATDAAGEALFLLVSDHGMSDVDPARSLHLDEAWPGIVQHLRHGRDGQVLAPAGSCRDLFLHVQPASLAEVEGRVAELVAPIATVHRVPDLLADGWFGPQPGPRLLGRLGDLVVIPAPGEAVWWDGGGTYRQRLLANHGGPWPGEMEVPLLALPIGG